MSTNVCDDVELNYQSASSAGKSMMDKSKSSKVHKPSRQSVINDIERNRSLSYASAMDNKLTAEDK